MDRRLHELVFVRPTTPAYPYDREYLQAVHVLLLRRPNAMKEADFSWLQPHEQAEVLGNEQAEVLDFTVVKLDFQIVFIY